MRRLLVMCDECGATTEGETWPEGWWHWHRRDLCHTCAVPVIREALIGCRDEEPPVPIWATPQAPGAHSGEAGSSGSMPVPEQ